MTLLDVRVLNRYKISFVFQTLLVSCLVITCQDSISPDRLATDAQDIEDVVLTDGGKDVQFFSPDVYSSFPEGDGRDLGSDGSQFDSSGTGDDDALPEGWVSCACEDPEDACYRGYICGRPQANCRLDDDLCPSGYRCGGIDGDLCLCDGLPEECHASCEKNADCPGAACDPHPDRSFCRPGSWCMNSMDCPEGSYCDEGGQCDRGGDTPVGGPCEDFGECETGICHHGVCAEQCLSDDDCEGLERCTRLARLDHNGCTENLNECPHDCSDGTRCNDNLGCMPAFCMISGDCEAGDCRQHDLRPDVFPGQCINYDEDVDKVCKPHELRAPDLDYCYLPGHCWSEDDCRLPYHCDGSSCSRYVGLEE